MCLLHDAIFNVKCPQKTVFKGDFVRNMYFGASNQLRIGVLVMALLFKNAPVLCCAFMKMTVWDALWSLSLILEKGKNRGNANHANHTKP